MLLQWGQVGTVEARYTYRIGPTAAGRLKQLAVEVGDVVQAGNLLGEMDPVDLDERIRAQSAAIKRAEAATRRVLGWTDAAKRGCAELGRAGDRRCEEQLLKDAATYSIAKEGHEGVIISVGAPVSVAVDPNARRTASE